MHITEAVQLVDAFVRYAYNAELDEFKELFPGYLLEKYKCMQDDCGTFFGDLDIPHRSLFVKMIVARYAKKENTQIDIDEGACDAG